MDIQAEKQRLRRELSSRRDSIPPDRRALFDEKMTERLTALAAFRDADIIYCFVSARSEPDTSAIIDRALCGGKTVACPRCIDNDGHMIFYKITSRSQLVRGHFGILEPDADRCESIGSQGGVCIVPALSFDTGGGRLGYGKGYYDRFLAEFRGMSIGLCYECMISREPLPLVGTDRRIDCIVTEKRTISCVRREQG